MDSRPIVGIDLGTTNSAVAIVQDGVPFLIPLTPNSQETLLPSYVGMSPDGQLLIGREARNQYALYPELTIRSIKRKMGQDVTVSLAEKQFSPTEISAFLLRRLKQAAEAHLKCPVERAVITVPAFFSDAQRTATREAGKLAGFEVERIINEPTAAALCYTSQDERDRTFLVYDLGGGTFDVSIVRVRGDITEVLSSHGDTALGGDDFDERLKQHLIQAFRKQHNVDLTGNIRANARLARAAEEAKILLSTESYVHVIEEHLATQDGIGLHLNEEISRHQYEEMILGLIEKTKISIQTALKEANLLIRDLDEVILVGGSTRTPLVSSFLQEQTKQKPRCDIDPEKAVALGAALQAARIAGDQKARILVDVSPYSFGTSYFGELRGIPSPHCYKAIIERNTPIPTRQTEVFYTMFDGQEAVEVRVFQGEELDARRNQQIGLFRVTGLDKKAEEGSPIVFALKLDLNGILEVEVTEKRTGLTKGITIEDAFRQMDAQELDASQRRIADLMAEFPWAGLWSGDDDSDDDDDDDDDNEALSTTSEDEHPLLAGLSHPDGLPEEQRGLWIKAVSLLEKTARILPDLAEVDREEVLELAQNLHTTLVQKDLQEAEQQTNELADVLFYLE